MRTRAAYGISDQRTMAWAAMIGARYEARLSEVMWWGDHWLVSRVALDR